MGEVIPREYITNALCENEYRGTLSSLDQEWVQMWKVQKLRVDHVGQYKAVAELIKEDEQEEEDKEDPWEGSSTEDLVPQQALALWATISVVPGFWAVGPSDEVAKRGPATNSTAQGKTPAIQAESILLAKTDEELVCHLQVEKLVVEEAHQGRDAATLEVVMEAATLLTHGQLEGLGVPVS